MNIFNWRNIPRAFLITINLLVFSSTANAQLENTSNDAIAEVMRRASQILHDAAFGTGDEAFRTAVAGAYFEGIGRTRTPAIAFATGATNTRWPTETLVIYTGPNFADNRAPGAVAREIPPGTPIQQAATMAVNQALLELGFNRIYRNPDELLVVLLDGHAGNIPSFDVRTFPTHQANRGATFGNPNGNPEGLVGVAMLPNAERRNPQQDGGTHAEMAIMGYHAREDAQTLNSNRYRLLAIAANIRYCFRCFTLLGEYRGVLREREGHLFQLVANFEARNPNNNQAANWNYPVVRGRRANQFQRARVMVDAGQRYVDRLRILRPNLVPGRGFPGGINFGSGPAPLP